MKRAAGPVLLVVALAALAAWKGAPAPTAPRAARITRASELVSGAGAGGRLGDWTLSNGLVTAVIDQLGPGQGAAESGGNVVDLAPCGGDDALSQVFTYFTDAFPRQALYDRIVPRANADEAALDVRGHDSVDPSIKVETSYVLRAGARYLLLRTTLVNQGKTTIPKFAVGDVVQWGHAERFLPGQGPRAKGKLSVPWGAGVGARSAIVYGSTSGRDVSGIHGGTWSDFVLDKPDLPPGERVTFERFLAVGERPDLASALQVAWPLLGKKTLGRLEGTVVEAGSGRPAQATVVIVQNDAPVSTAAAGADGRFAADLPAGRYMLTTLARDRAPGEPVPLDVVDGRAPAPVQLAVSAPGRLRVTMTSAGAPSAGKLVLEGIDGTADPELGPSYAAAGAANTALTHDGRLALTLPPGRYRATCARGIEFDVDVHEIAVRPAGPGVEPTALACDLRRAVETPGRIAMDLHQHATPSYDAAVALEDRVIADLAEGLEGFVASDHNVITDYTAAVKKLGVGKRLVVITGDEATVENLGHFNAYPLAASARAARGGAPHVLGLAAPAIFKILRALPGPRDRVIQVNHPRAGREGFFDKIGFDPGKPGYPDGFALDFDAVEVLNGKRSAETDPALRDFFELLRRGKLVTAVGNSDTHAIFGTEAGYPRNLIAVPHDDPARTSAADIVRAVKVTRDVIVTNGPILSVSIRGAGPGAHVAAAGLDLARVPVRIRVEAAPWIDVDHVDVYLDGRLALPSLPVASSRERLRFDREVPIAAHGGGPVVVIARGSQPLSPVVSNVDKHPTTPYALANPIWIDAAAKPPAAKRHR